MFYTLQKKTATGWVDIERFADRDLAWRELENLERRGAHVGIGGQFRWVRDIVN